MTTTLNLEAIRARAEEGSWSHRLALLSTADVPALCSRVEALEAALADALSLYATDHSEESHRRHSAASAVLEGKP